MSADNQTADVEEHAIEISDRTDASVGLKTVLEKITDYTDHDVPMDEAVNQVKAEFGVTGPLNAASRNLQSDDKQRNLIHSIDSAGEWVNVAGQVVRCWDSTGRDAEWVGLIADPTDVIKLVIWENAPNDISKGDSLQVENVAVDVDKHSDKLELHANSVSAVTKMDDTISLKPEMTGIVTSVIPGSLNQPEDESEEPELRAQLVVDFGGEVVTSYVPEDILKSVCGLSLDSALTMIQEAGPDADPVDTYLRNEFLGKFIQFEANTYQSASYATSLQRLEPTAVSPDIFVDTNKVAAYQADPQNPTRFLTGRELNAISNISPVSDDEYATKMAQLPTGGVANRVAIPATVTNITDISGSEPNYKVCLITPTGERVFVYAGEYDKDRIVDRICDISVPEHVLVCGKPRLLTTRETGSMVKLSPEEFIPLTPDERETMDAIVASQTRSRLEDNNSPNANPQTLQLIEDAATELQN